MFQPLERPIDLDGRPWRADDSVRLRRYVRAVIRRKAEFACHIHGVPMTEDEIAREFDRAWRVILAEPRDVCDELGRRPRRGKRGRYKQRKSTGSTK